MRALPVSYTLISRGKGGRKGRQEGEAGRGRKEAVGGRGGDRPDERSKENGTRSFPEQLQSTFRAIASPSTLAGVYATPGDDTRWPNPPQDGEMLINWRNKKKPHRAVGRNNQKRL